MKTIKSIDNYGINFKIVKIVAAAQTNKPVKKINALKRDAARLDLKFRKFQNS